MSSLFPDQSLPAMVAVDDTDTLFDWDPPTPAAGAVSNTAPPLSMSAIVGNNDVMFAALLDMYVAPGAIIADTTWGNGAFWKKVTRTDVTVLASDLEPRNPSPLQQQFIAADATMLPYADSSVDAMVFDPPYMHTPGGSAYAGTGTAGFEQHYRNNRAPNRSGLKYHDAVLDLYVRQAHEAHRVLVDGGVYMVKCMDEICSNVLRATHIEITNALEGSGMFQLEDIGVVVSSREPQVSKLHGAQVHLRKNHSYFLVFWKKPGPWAKWKGPHQRGVLARRTL